jgi:hypothetical protein
MTTVRLSSFNVSAFVALAIGIATALPVTAPREFDRVVRTTRSSVPRPGSWDSAPGHGDEHAEAPAAMASCPDGEARPGTPELPVEGTGSRFPQLTAGGEARTPPGPAFLPARGVPAPTGRAPPLT